MGTGKIYNSFLSSILHHSREGEYKESCGGTHPHILPPHPRGGDRHQRWTPRGLFSPAFRRQCQTRQNPKDNRPCSRQLSEESQPSGCTLGVGSRNTTVLGSNRTQVMLSTARICPWHSLGGPGSTSQSAGHTVLGPTRSTAPAEARSSFLANKCPGVYTSTVQHLWPGRSSLARAKQGDHLTNATKQTSM